MNEYETKGKDTYTQEEAFQSSLNYFNGDELAARVWVNKYALKDSYGNIFEKNPDDMHRRLAKEISRIENRYPNPLSEDTIFEVLRDFKYIVPQGGPMTGIGNEFQIASLSNCFVIGNEGPSDSYGGVMKIDQEQVQLMKRRGGVGHDLSHIRPKGSPVKNSALTSTGIVPFMERYSNSTREVAQDGRRGALMLSVSINHPDSESFIDAKMTEGKVTGANVSVKIDDEFMRAVINDEEYEQKYPVYSDEPKNRKQINARQLWNKIVHNAWKSAEPGILFWDTIIRESVPDCYADKGYRTVSTNPCGEIPLCPYDSCRLLAINLYSYVQNPFTKGAFFDFPLFKKHVAIAQRIMDDIIDLELEKIDAILDKVHEDPESEEVKGVEIRLWEKIKQKAKEGRRTGVGITAEGDMLAALGLRYGSEEAIDFAVDIQKTLAVEAYRASVHLAKDRGTFKIYDTRREENNPFIKRLREADPDMYAEMVKYGRRNIACLTIAPTGTIAQGVGAKQVNSKGEIYEDKYGITTSQRVYGTTQENLEGRGPCYLRTEGIDKEKDTDLKKAYLNMAPSQTLKWIEQGKDPSEQNVEIEGTEPYIVGGHTASGYWVNTKRETTIYGLYAAGDVAGGCPQKYVTGALVEGEIAALDIVEKLKTQTFDTTDVKEEQLLDDKVKEYNHILSDKDSIFTIEQMEEAMQKVMDAYAGGISSHYQFNENCLNLAKEKINNLITLSGQLSAKDYHELMFYYELKERLTICLTLIEHLKARKETRWHSFAENLDYPQKSDDWKKYVNTKKVDGKIQVILRELVKEDEQYEHQN